MDMLTLRRLSKPAASVR